MTALGGIVGGVSAVDGFWMFPQARSDKFAEETLALQHFSNFGRATFGGLRVEIGFHDIVIMKLYAVEAELLVLSNLGGKSHLFPHRRTKGIRSGGDVPGAEREAIGGFAQPRGP